MPTRTEGLIEDEKLRQIDTRWKSDVDLKLDRLVRFADVYESYLKMAMEREADRRLFRKAVIEKTFTGFIWVCLGIVGAALWNYLRLNLRGP